MPTIGTRAATLPAMSVRSFFGEDASRQVTAAIREVEQATSAEVVVAVRASSGHYRHVDYLVGALLAFAGLLVFIFHPRSFGIDLFPLEAAALFASRVLLSAWMPPIRRLLSSRRLRADNVRTAARAAFVELGIASTSARTGLLVFVSTLERRVEVVADTGVTRSAAGPDWNGAIAKLAQTVESDPELTRFVDALRDLGRVLERALPARADDVNELPDEVQS